AAVALLVLLARPAGAGVVAAHLVPLPHVGLLLGGLLRRGLGLFRRQGVRLGVLEFQLLAGLGLPLAALQLLHLVVAAHFETAQEADGLQLDVVEHGLEEAEGFPLVLLLGILLGV